MRNDYLDTKFLHQFENPMQKLIELNVKTIQGMSYMRPGDLLNIRKPEDLFERNMDMFLQNSQIALNYIKDTFSILGSHFMSVPHEVEENAKKVMRPVTTAVKKNVSSKAKSTAKKASSSAKNVNSAKPAAKVAKPASKVVKSVKTAAKPVAKSAAKGSKPTTKAKVKKPVAKVAKTAAPGKAKVASPVKSVRPEIKPMHGMHNKDAGHGTPKVNSLTEKTGIKDLGLHINKGPNFSN